MKKIMAGIFLAASATAFVSATFVLLDKIDKLNKLTYDLADLHADKLVGLCDQSE